MSTLHVMQRATAIREERAALPVISSRTVAACSNAKRALAGQLGLTL